MPMTGVGPRTTRLDCARPLTARARFSATLAFLIVGIGALVTVAYFYLQSSKQPRSGQLELVGLEDRVDVHFDEWAIPTITGSTRADVAYAQGFVHASERLWQMELFQRIVRGRLAALFGEPALDTDRLLRTLDLWSAAGSELRTLDAGQHLVLEAYAAGVNARLDTWRGPWPPEFLILGIDPQPWTAQASVAIGRVMALDLSGWRTELSRTNSVARLPVDRRDALFARYPAWGPTIVQDGSLAQGESGEALPRPRESLSTNVLATPVRLGSATSRSGSTGWDPLEFLASFALHSSNSWAIRGARTADGHPLLANDMHLSLRAPSTWYLNVLRAEGPGTAVAGLSIPGAPGVVVGLNQRLAWAFTNAMLDDADFVVESLNLDQTMYRDVGGWRPFEVRDEEIEVRGRSEPVTHRVRTTVRGPILTDAVPAGGLTLSVLWTGRRSEGAVGAILDMNEARTEEDFVQAVRRFRSPHQNVIYASTSGALGFRMSGSIPRRSPGEGPLPISAEALPTGWAEFWPSDSLPALRDPSADYLSSANNLQSRTSYGRVGIRYPAPFRARRIEDRVRTARGWTVTDMRDLQLDTYGLWAERFRPRAVAAALRVGDEDLADELEAWDLGAEVDAVGAASFYAWLYRLRELIAADEFDGGDFWFPDLAMIEIVEDGRGPWIDDLRTPEVETLEALEEEAARTASALVGARWGDMHLERSEHPLGQVRLLDRILGFNVGPYPGRGARHTVRPGPLRSALDSTSWTYPMTGAYGPSERFVAHLDPENPRGYFLLPTGQAGNPLDVHYRDMSAVWSESPLIELSPTGPPLRSRSILVLLPASP